MRALMIIVILIYTSTALCGSEEFNFNCHDFNGEVVVTGSLTIKKEIVNGQLAYLDYVNNPDAAVPRFHMLMIKNLEALNYQGEAQINQAKMELPFRTQTLLANEIAVPFHSSFAKQTFVDEGVTLAIQQISLSYDFADDKLPVGELVLGLRDLLVTTMGFVEQPKGQLQQDDAARTVTLRKAFTAQLTRVFPHPINAGAHTLIELPLLCRL